MPNDRNWSLTLWAAVGVSVIVGAFHSPLTAVRVVRVVGSVEAHKPSLDAISADLKGAPALQVSLDGVADRAMAFSATKSVNVTANAFGRMTVRIAYREPVARIAGESSLCLDATGALFQATEGAFEGPEIKLFDGALRPMLTLTELWPARSVATLAIESKKFDAGPGTTIEVDAGGAVSLITASGATVRFGSTENLDAKLAKLTELTRRRSDLFQVAKSINLVEPNFPTWIPKSAR